MESSKDYEEEVVKPHKPREEARTDSKTVRGAAEAIRQAYAGGDLGLVRSLIAQMPKGEKFQGPNGLSLETLKPTQREIDILGKSVAEKLIMALVVTGDRKKTMIGEPDGFPIYHLANYISQTRKAHDRTSVTLTSWDSETDPLPSGEKKTGIAELKRQFKDLEIRIIFSPDTVVKIR